jgi:DNA polymerase
MSTMTTLLYPDFETRSELDLKEVGLYRYARHPSTDVWCLSWAIDDEEPILWVRGQPCPDRLRAHVEAGGKVVAHNAAFELAIWNCICVPRYGFPPLKPEQCIDTLAMAYAMGLPGALENVAYALGLRFQKDTQGYLLMLRYASPWRRNPTQWMDENPSFTCGGEKYTGATGLARLHEYCHQDIRVCREVYGRLMPLSAKEQRVWLLDYKINQRGVAIDLAATKGALLIADKMKVALNEEMAKVTGGAVQECSAILALKDWLASKGVAKESLAKQEVVDLLADLEQFGGDPAVIKALRLRQEAAKSSTAKFKVMVNQVGDDGRMHNLYAYHGAGPGRWAGRQPQVHNLPRDMPKAEAVENILQLVREGDFRGIDMIYGAPLTAMSRCLRSFFVAPAGKKIVGGDWSNVEGRGQAWFVNEEWKLKAFAAADAKQGPGIYELAYSRMFNVPVESILNPSEERQVGKVAELAFGYGGGVGTFHVMGKTYGVKVSDAQAETFKQAWRAAHPRISTIWKELERAAIAAVRNPGEMYEAGWPGRTAKYRVVGSFLWCQLPSGRVICYPFPKLLPGEYGDILTYMTVPSELDRRTGKIIDDPANNGAWARLKSWGGQLLNNVVQGFCSDFLRDVMLEVDDNGGEIVLHTHDDVNLEVADQHAEKARVALQAMMRRPGAWAAGFPLHANCVIMQRYGK